MLYWRIFYTNAPTAPFLRKTSYSRLGFTYMHVLVSFAHCIALTFLLHFMFSGYNKQVLLLTQLSIIKQCKSLKCSWRPEGEDWSWYGSKEVRRGFDLVLAPRPGRLPGCDGCLIFEVNIIYFHNVSSRKGGWTFQLWKQPEELDNAKVWLCPVRSHRYRCRKDNSAGQPDRCKCLRK